MSQNSLPADQVPDDRLAGLVLAAGASARLGRAKPLLLKQGRPLVVRAAMAAAAVCGAGVTVVTGAGGAAVAQALTGLPVSCLQHDDWQQGMGSSLAAGVAAVAGRPCAAVLVTLCDQPRVGAAQLAALVQLWQNAPAVPAAAAYAGRVGVPAVFPRSWFARLAVLSADHGARDLLRAAGDVQTLDMPAAAADIDTPDDLHWLDATDNDQQV